MFRLKELEILGSKAELSALPEGKLLINTINAHSYNTARKDKLFAEALTNGDVLIPDGVSIVKACKWIKAKSQPKERIAGWDLFSFEMGKLERESEERRVKSEESSADNDNQVEGKSKIDNSSSASADNSCLGKRLYEPSATPNPQHSTFINSSSASADNSTFNPQLSTFRSPQRTVMFMGSSQKVLDLIVKRASEVYPHLKVVTYSPPYKPEFSDDDNKAIIDAINAADPDLLWIGMTAPKQEKWTYSHWDELNIHCHVGTIGAVFDFFAGTVERAPMWWQRHGLEWLYRLLKEPKRMWRRYIIGNALFLWNMLKEKC
ncbi:MAG: WecB/TagA/CpsF family glycosyltransferase [Prevotella sp.]|nr:WecB/TagA/CpsF family glycosyltransferase [Prevotella sp.]